MYDSASPVGNINHEKINVRPWFALVGRLG
jgi:hypothetical protein